VDAGHRSRDRGGGTLITASTSLSMLVSLTARRCCFVHLVYYLYQFDPRHCRGKNILPTESMMYAFSPPSFAFVATCCRDVMASISILDPWQSYKTTNKSVFAKPRSTATVLAKIRDGRCLESGSLGAVAKTQPPCYQLLPLASRSATRGVCGRVQMQKHAKRPWKGLVVAS
jgi:hypothetical protein